MADQISVPNSGQNQDQGQDQGGQQTTDSPLNQPLPSEVLGGKYSTVSDLVQAHEEAQRKITELGQGQGQGEQGETPAQEGEQPQAEGQPSIPDDVFDSIRQSYLETGELSPDNRRILNSYGIPDQAIDQYIAGQAALGNQYKNAVLETFGGAEKFTEISRWAANNLPEDEIDAVNQALNSFDLGLARQTAAGLVARFNSAVREPGHQIQGQPNQQAGGVVPYKSHQEMLQAMRDPRYSGPNADSAYQEEVMRRAQASNF